MGTRLGVGLCTTDCVLWTLAGLEYSWRYSLTYHHRVVVYKSCTFVKPSFLLLWSFPFCGLVSTRTLSCSKFHCMSWLTVNTKACHTLLSPSLVPRPSPTPVFEPAWLSFCILQAIKNRSRGRPGNEASSPPCAFRLYLASFPVSHTIMVCGMGCKWWKLEAWGV